MADAVRLISIRRGYDPREFCLVAFGGAGPLHGAALAEELSIPTVLVPPSPGITSALGCLLVDVRHDLSAMFLAHVDAVDLEALEAEFGRLEAEGRERLAAEGVSEEQMSIQRLVDMRYLGQWRSLTVPVSAPDGYDRRGHPVPRRARARLQLPSRRVAGRDLPAQRAGDRRDAEAAAQAARAERCRCATPQASRRVHFDSSGDAVDTPLYLRAELPAGAKLDGPAIIDQLDSTTLVPPGWRAEVDEWLNIRMHREESP